MVWFHIIFTNKSKEKRAHPPPPLKPKRIRRKEEKRERKLQRRAEKREEVLQVPPEQRLLEEQAKLIEEVADRDSRWAEVEESQGGKPCEDTLTNPFHPLHSSDSLSHKEFCEPSEDEASEDVEENSTKSFHLTPSSVCSKSSKGQRIPSHPLHSSDSLPRKEFCEPSKDEASEDVKENSSKSFHLTPSSVCSKGQRIRHKEERRERNRQKKWERKEQAAATRLFMIPIERIIGGALAEKEEPPVPKTRGAAALEDDATIRNKQERRKRKRQRKAERKETSSQVLPDPTQDCCYSDEAEELYDEWATEETMQLLSGELGGPNLLQNIFGRTREGALMVRSRGGALEDDPNICKVCKISFQRLLKHLASSADCAQEYDLQKMHEENKAKSAAKRVENKRNKRKAERAEAEPAFKAKAAAQRTKHRKAERAEDEPAFKAKAAAQKKINDDALRAKDEEGFRAKMAAKEKKRQDALREKDEPGLKEKAAAKKRNQRKEEVTNQFDMIRKFWRDTEDGWSYSCVCCHKLKFDNQVVEFEEPLISRIGQQWIEEAIGEPDPRQERFGKYYICHYCKNKLLQNKMPPISHKNTLDLVDLEPHPELKTTPLENSLIAKNLVFQKIVQLPKSRWSGTKDKIVNVPINDQDIVDTMERLPRTPDEAGLVCIELKRKLEYKNTHKTEYISVSKVEKALDTLYDLGHPHYQFVGDMAGFEERCKKEEPLLSFDRLSDFSFKKTPAKNGPKKCRKKPQLDFEHFFKSLRKAPIWPFSFQFCINPYSFYFWGCQLDMTFIESEEFRSWPEEAQMLARDPWFIFIAKKNRMFWEGEPKRIYDAALSNGWKGAKLSQGLSWVGEDIDMGPTTTVITPSFTPNFEMQWIPKPKNWYGRRTVHRNKAKKVGRRRASIGTLSKAMLGEVVQCVPLSWQKCKPWRHFNPTTATG